jgi:Fe-S oxidoreductase
MTHLIQERKIRLNRTAITSRAAYHDPCNYGRRAQQFFGKAFYDEPRWILDQCLQNWVDLYPCREHQICCGGGGGALTTGYNEERLQYGKRKVDQILAAKAEMIIVPCCSCHGQFESLKKAHHLDDLQIKYLWEVVADCLVL